MSDRMTALLEQRARLVAQARVEREHLAVTVDRIESSLSWIDMLRRVGNEVRSHPLGVFGALAVLAVLRPRGVLTLVGSGWWLWRLYQRLRRLWALAVAVAANRAASRT